MAYVKNNEIVLNRTMKWVDRLTPLARFSGVSHDIWVPVEMYRDGDFCPETGWRRHILRWNCSIARLEEDAAEAEVRWPCSRWPAVRRRMSCRRARRAVAADGR